MSTEQEEYVILLHEDHKELLEDYLKRPDKYAALKIWHVEPVSRFEKYPPGNPAWKLFEKVKGFAAAINRIKEIEKSWLAETRKPARTVSLSTRYKVLKRDGFKCRLCGRTTADGVKLEVDHKTPKSLGGENAFDNLWTLCSDCNRGKSNRDISVPREEPHA